MKNQQEPTWQGIGPQDLLPIGTPVLVQGKHGKVVKAEMVESSNRSGLICLHTCKFYTRKEETNLWVKWKRISRPKEEQVNYSFIQAYL